VCARYDVSLAAAALQFPLAHPAVASVVTGMRGRREADANRAHCEARIPADFWAELKQQALIAADAPVPQSDPDRNTSPDFRFRGRQP
jgi:D-threo-aldose 1-dehydrogenase